MTRSSAEPPPIATSASGGRPRIRSASASTSSAVGSPGCLPDDVQPGRGRGHGGQGGERASTTTVAAAAPSSASTSGSAAITPSPNLIRTGRWNENGSITTPSAYPAAGPGCTTGPVGHEYGMADATPDPAATTGRLARAYAWTVVKLRWPILLGWSGAAAYAAAVAPAPAQPPDSLVSLVPADSPALRANAIALRLFRIPLTAETEVVQRDPRGLPAGVRARVYTRAARLDRAALQGRPRAA